MTASRLLPLALLWLASGAARAQDDARSLNPLAAIDKSSLKGFVEQPLFEPSRHPPLVAAPIVVETPPPPPPVVERPPPLHVLGVVEGAHSRAAIVRREDTGKTETLHPGDRIGSWSVVVLPTGVRVQSGERAFDYALFRGELQSGPVPVVPAPTVAARDAMPAR